MIKVTDTKFRNLGPKAAAVKIMGIREWWCWWWWEWGRGRKKRELFIGEGGGRYRVGRTKGRQGSGGETNSHGACVCARPSSQCSLSSIVIGTYEVVASIPKFTSWFQMAAPALQPSRQTSNSQE